MKTNPSSSIRAYRVRPLAEARKEDTHEKEDPQREPARPVPAESPARAEKRGKDATQEEGRMSLPWEGRGRPCEMEREAKTPQTKEAHGPRAGEGAPEVERDVRG